MSSSPGSPASKSVRCPICGKAAVEAYRPFCSKRCADIDLGKWFSGSYAVAGRDEDEGDAAATTPGEEGSEKDEN